MRATFHAHLIILDLIIRIIFSQWLSSRLRLKCDDTRAETRFRLSAKRTSPFKSAAASVPSSTGSRGVRISGSNVGYTMFRGSMKSTVNPLHSSVSLSLPLPCVTVCHHISTGLYCGNCLFENYCGGLLFVNIQVKVNGADLRNR